MVVLRSHSLALQAPARRTSAMAVFGATLGWLLLASAALLLRQANIEPSAASTAWLQLAVAAGLVVLLLAIWGYCLGAARSFGHGGIAAELDEAGVRFPSYPGAGGGRFFAWRDIDEYRLLRADQQSWWWRRFALLDRLSAPCLLIVRLQVAPRGWRQIYGGWRWRLLYAPHLVACGLAAALGRSVPVQEGIDAGIADRSAIETVLAAMFEDEGARARYGANDHEFSVALVSRALADGKNAG